MLAKVLFAHAFDEGSCLGGGIWINIAWEEAWMCLCYIDICNCLIPGISMLTVEYTKQMKVRRVFIPKTDLVQAQCNTLMHE